MKKILIVLTNIEKYETINRATGLWLGEAIHFYDELIKAGYEVDFVSPKGGYVPIDPDSFKYAKEIDWELYNDDKFKNRALSNTLKPSDINYDEYIAIFYTGGHGVIWDFKDNEELQLISQKIYENNGYITSVCHGCIGLLNIKDKSGEYLIKGKSVTGFSNMEEKINRTSGKIPYSSEAELKKRGANYKSKRAFSEFVVVDGKIITGQNPQSAKKVAQELLNKLKPINGVK